MENNTFISHELEEMRSQIGILKETLEKQNIVNEKHIRNSMKSKMSSISKTVTSAIFLGVFALIYCTWFFWTQGLSTFFVVATAIMLTVCLGLTILQQIRLKSLDFSKGNLVQTAEQLNKVKKHYREWHWVAIPMIVIWIGWLIYEILELMGTEPYVIGFCCGGLLGALIGGLIGTRMNNEVIRKTSELLSQIEELQKGE